MDEHVVVVGAGPAGLAAAWAIRRAGPDPLVVDQADEVAASWRGRHDHLRLNTHRMFSHQPGARIPRRCGSYPARDDYVAYLQEYSAGMRLRLGTRVHTIDRTDGGWTLALEAGSLTAAHAVIATGSDAEPVLPGWPGLAGRPMIAATFTPSLAFWIDHGLPFSQALLAAHPARCHPQEPYLLHRP